MHPAAATVRANDDFSLSVVFDDGTRGLLDMKPYLGFGVFKRLQAPEAFKRVRVAFDTVQWDCGVDLDPEFVHAKSRLNASA
jgi:hypothetical protein